MFLWVPPPGPVALRDHPPHEWDRAALIHEASWLELPGHSHRGGGGRDMQGHRQLCRELSRGQDPPALILGVDSVGSTAQGLANRLWVHQL